MKAFEVHVQQGERWRIDSVFDDRDLALLEAQRLEQSVKFRAIRVVEESYDERTNRSRSQVVYEREIRSAGPDPRRGPPLRADMPLRLHRGGATPSFVAEGGVSAWHWMAAACALAVGITIGALLGLG